MSNPLVLAIPLCLALLGAPPILAEHPITVDGDLTVEEWGEGANQPNTDQGRARLIHREDGLYLAVRCNFFCMADVMVQRGDTLRQLHVSGQVGGARFERGSDGLWHLAETYPWIDEVKSRDARMAEMKERLQRSLAAKKPKPSSPAGKPSQTPPTAPPSSPPTATPGSKPPSPPPLPTPPKKPTSAEEKAIVARHLEEHGWTGTGPNLGDPKTAEFFLSSDLLRPGDRLLVMWPRRDAEDPSTITTETFPVDAEPMPDGHSAAHETSPFAHSFAGWYVIE